VKSAIWIVLFVLGLTGVLIPTSCFYIASQLPSLESEFDLRSQLRRRGGSDSGAAEPHPDFARLPRDLIALYISQLGCPTFFRTQREDGARWAWRVMAASAGWEQGGDGACELRLALRLATAVGIRGNLRQFMAAHKIHAFLQKDQLISYDLQFATFDRGLVGIDAAAKVLFNQDLRALELSQMAELILALPPSDLFHELKACRNPALIRQSRDQMLILAARDSLLSLDSMQAARVEPAYCTRN
jgi:hypothetical protein